MLPAIQTPYEPEVRYMERALELAELAAAEAAGAEAAAEAGAE